MFTYSGIDDVVAVQREFLQIPHPDVADKLEEIAGRVDKALVDGWGSGDSDAIAAVGILARNDDTEWLRQGEWTDDVRDMIVIVRDAVNALLIDAAS